MSFCFINEWFSLIFRWFSLIFRPFVYAVVKAEMGKITSFGDLEDKTRDLKIKITSKIMQRTK